MHIQRAGIVGRDPSPEIAMGLQAKSECLGASDLQHLRLNNLEYAIQHFDRGQ